MYLKLGILTMTVLVSFISGASAASESHINSDSISWVITNQTMVDLIGVQT